MCQQCVDEGRMTQAELDEANKTPSDPRANGALVKEIFGPDLEDAPAFIKELLGVPDKDPEAEAQETMDKQVAQILDFYRSKRDLAVEMAPAGISMESARGRDTLASALAGELMFKQNPSAIAFTLTVLTGRYLDLLDQWATLYVKAAADADGDEINLDAATNPETKTAVTKAATAQDVHLPTGMYL
jgi:hypothetical protein